MIKLVIVKNGGDTGHDVTELVDKITWSGRKGAAPRCLKATLLDDDGIKHARVTIDCEEGYQCAFYENDIELFRGLIVTHSQSNKKTMTFTAYDNMYYLANNKDSFSYKKKRADEIFQDCLTRTGLLLGETVNTEYVIPELPKAKTTYYDVLLDALSTTYKATGTRYYIASDKGRIHLLRRKEHALQWVLEVGANVTGYTYTKSIDKIRTRIRMLSKTDAVVYENANTELEQKIGVFAEITSAKEKMKKAQMKETVDTMLSEKGFPTKTLQVSGLGITEAIAGGCVFTIIPHLDVNRTFYIDEDSHEFSGNKHTMTLKLNFAADIHSAG